MLKGRFRHLDLTDDLLFIFNRNGVLLQSNSAASSLLCSSNSKKRKNPTPDRLMLYFNKTKLDLRELLVGALPVARSSLLLKLPDGRERRVDLKAAIIPGSPGKIQLLLKDVTELRKYEVALKENEERMRVILEEGPLGLVVINPEGKPGYINQTFLNMSGYSRERLSRFDLASIIAGEDLQLFSGHLRRLFKESNRCILNGEFRIITQNKDERMLNVTSSMVRDASGDPAFGIMMLEDITEKKQTELKLMEAKRELESYSRELEHLVQQRSGELIFKNKELEGAIIELKEAQSHLVQSEKMAVLGNLIAGIAHEINTPNGILQSSIESITEDLEYSLAHLPELIRSLDPSHYTIWNRILVRAMEHQKAMNAFSGQRKIRQELQHELQQMEVPFKRNFPALLANCGYSAETLYEIRELLTLPGKEEMIRTASKLAEIALLVETVDIASRRISKVIGALQSYSRGSVQERQLTPDDHSPFNLKEGLETVLTLYQNRLKERIQVIRNYEQNPGINGNRDEINQVWTNLINNAIYAIPGRGRLELTLSETESTAEVVIRDSGTGIPPDIHKEIFNPFFTTKPRGEGNGLGLNIVRNIINKHGGSIDVESDGKSGTEFRVILPKNLKGIKESQ